jgi:Glycosyltransferase family 87
VARGAVAEWLGRGLQSLVHRFESGRRLFVSASLATGAHRVSTALVFGVLPLLLVCTFLAASWHRSTFLFDFHGDLYRAGREIVHGHNPYHAAYLSREVALKRAGQHVKTDFAVAVYPAPTLVAAVPFTLLPYRAAGIVYALLSVCALIAGLSLLGVRDARCYGAAFLSWPVLHGLMLGALTPLLVPGVAALWRWRDEVWRPAVALAAIVTAKLFLWPLGVWLILTRRYGTLARAVAVSAVAVLAGWAVIGFDGIVNYPRMLGDLSFIEQGVGVSPVAGLLSLGLGSSVARIAAVALALALLAFARLGPKTGRERRTFGIAVVAALVASPIVWPHYFMLVLVPIALLSPRLSALWFVPLAAYLAPVAQTNDQPWAVLPYYAIIAVVAYSTLRHGESPPATAPIPHSRVPATLGDSAA